ncbi:MAG: HD domain-containing protein [Clostridia bacterium]|nr:HD domain-containing protein [Clostridia bacterium]
MKNFLPQKLISLAEILPRPLYAVGGVVRNFLIDQSISDDFDLAGAITSDKLVCGLNKIGLKVLAEYKRTGTVMFSDGQRKYEFTTFRSESYLGGEHTPYKTEFTEDIKVDALRRDFKCNAVYFDIRAGEYIDPLGGIKDIIDRRLNSVTKAEKVFSNDGLRLMRLARFAGELNFKPNSEVLGAAMMHADNIKEISPERVYAELIRILHADKKYAFSDPQGHYTGLKILDETRVLDRIFPELTDGRGMAQRADFHRYDVLEHSLRTVLYADENIRLAALLHDIGKPFCYLRDGYYYHHFSEGERIAEAVLKRLKASNETIKQVKFLVREHMVDLDCSMKESKVRRFLVKNEDKLKDLLAVKQADFRASLETDDVAPTLVKWGRIYRKMKKDGTPFTLKELKVNAADLIEIGYKKDGIGKELKKLWDLAIVNPEKNQKELLIETAKQDLKI